MSNANTSAAIASAPATQLFQGSGTGVARMMTARQRRMNIMTKCPSPKCDWCGPGANARKKRQQADDSAEAEPRAVVKCSNSLCRDGYYPDGDECPDCEGLGHR